MDFEALIDQAWPALERETVDGWTFRSAGGVTKRANSVMVIGEPADLDGVIEAAEKYYADRGLPTLFTLGGQAPPGLDGVLEERGYWLADPVLCMTGPVADTGIAHEVRIEERPWAGWLESWWSVDGRYGEGYETAERIAGGVPAWYAAVEEGGTAAAVGRAVLQGDTVGVYCMATLPRARRRGLARSVLRALVRQGARAGARSAYLVVMAENTAAVDFYRGEGFTESSGYHYRIK